MSEIDIEELEVAREKPDFRRANGSPQWFDDDGKNQRGSRPSNWGKDLDEQSALTNWRIDKASIGVAHSRDLQAAWVACDFEDRAERKRLREASIQTGRGNEAADLGTALHAMTVRWEIDTDFSPPEPYLSALTAYGEAMDRLGLTSELFEYQIVNETMRAAGTADRLYRTTRPLPTPDGGVLPPGSFIVGDVKTGESLLYSMPGYVVQSALYAAGRRYDVIADRFFDDSAQYDVNQDWALIVHLPIDEGICEFFWIDLEVGRWGAYLVEQQRSWRKMWRSGEYDTPLARPHLEVVETPPEATDETNSPATSVVTVEDLLAWCQERINRIGDDPRARQHLTTFWPDDVPPPKIGGHTMDQVEALMQHLDETESKFSLGFVEGDPRVTPGVHKDALSNRSEDRTDAPASAERSGR